MRIHFNARVIGLALAATLAVPSQLQAQQPAALDTARHLFLRESRACALCHSELIVDRVRDLIPIIVPVNKTDAHLPRRHAFAVTTPRAWVRSDRPGTIFIATWTETFKRAGEGDRNAVKELAGLIAHETYHVIHGPDEGPAYQQQLEVLKAVGANGAAISRARDAQRIVAPLFVAPKKVPTRQEVDCGSLQKSRT